MSKGDNRLPVLADGIRAAHAQARAGAKMTLEHSIQAGEKLLEAKTLVGHGRWLPWLTDNCDIPERTAQLYMRLAKNKATLDIKSATVADLTIRGAIDVLTPPDEGDLVRTSVWLIGRHNNHEVWVIPSYQHPSYCYVTHVAARPDDTAALHGWKLPLNADWVPYAVVYLLPDVATQLVWGREALAPWLFNMWFFRTLEDFVDDITDIQVYANLASGRPPKWPNLPETFKVEAPNFGELVAKAAEKNAEATRLLAVQKELPF